MEENRRRQQDALRARHDAEIQASGRSRQDLADQHARLRDLVEGSGMKNPADYKESDQLCSLVVSLWCHHNFCRNIVAFNPGSNLDIQYISL